MPRQLPGRRLLLPAPARQGRRKDAQVKKKKNWRQGFLLEFLNFGQWVHEHAQIISEVSPPVVHVPCKSRWSGPPALDQLLPHNTNVYGKERFKFKVACTLTC